MPRRDDILGVAAGDDVAGEAHLALGDAGQPDHGVERRGLAGAVGAEQGDDLAFHHLEIDAAHCLDGAVADMKVRYRQHRRHAAVTARR